MKRQGLLGDANNPKRSLAVSFLILVAVVLAVIFVVLLGLSFFGGRFRDARLLGYAYAFEQATRRRRAPDFRPGIVV